VFRQQYTELSEVDPMNQQETTRGSPPSNNSNSKVRFWTTHPNNHPEPVWGNHQLTDLVTQQADTTGNDATKFSIPPNAPPRVRPPPPHPHAPASPSPLPTRERCNLSPPNNPGTPQHQPIQAQFAPTPNDLEPSRAIRDPVPMTARILQQGSPRHPITHLPSRGGHPQ
jgi:hypothetical protein